MSMARMRDTHRTDPTEDLRLEVVVVSVGFSDVLDHTIRDNLPHSDTFVVVTDHEDRDTQAVARKWGATCVLSDLHKKDNARFNKGALINAGFDRFRFFGWRLHLDCDVILPRTFRRDLFNSVPLDRRCLYSCDRVNVHKSELHTLRTGTPREPGLFSPEWGHRDATFVTADRPIDARTISTLHGWLPQGYFQLWHASHQAPYPHSLGTAAHDDEAFSAQWPRAQRVLLPDFIVYHVVTERERANCNDPSMEA